MSSKTFCEIGTRIFDTPLHTKQFYSKWHVQLVAYVKYVIKFAPLLLIHNFHIHLQFEIFENHSYHPFTDTYK